MKALVLNFGQKKAFARTCQGTRATIISRRWPSEPTTPFARRQFFGELICLSLDAFSDLDLGLSLAQNLMHCNS